MYGTTVTRGAAHTQYTVRIPKYSAQYRPHAVMGLVTFTSFDVVHVIIRGQRLGFPANFELRVVIRLPASWPSEWSLLSGLRVLLLQDCIMMV